jgi:hypothetical protein
MGERNEIQKQLVQGVKVDLSGFSFADRMALAPFVHESSGTVIGWPRVTTTADGGGEPDRMRDIAERLGSLARSGFTDPRAFLRDADPEALANLLSPEDFDYVMQRRAEMQAARTRAVPAPEPQKPTREAVAAEVLRRHAAGADVNTIAREMKTGRTLVQYIIDNK